jgi:hypothetical protein
MTYQAGGSIQASDYANLIGSGTTANTLNTVWSTGGGSAGYGQTALPGVTTGNTVQATTWANLINRTANAASHQGSTITTVTVPVTGGLIAFLSAVPTNLQTIYSNRLNAASQGSSTANSYVIDQTWTSGFQVFHTVSFANGDAARYFFNAGGQIKMTYAHANNAAGINFEYNQLCTAIGTTVVSSPSSGTITIAGVSFNGITKVGGSGSTAQLGTNRGYYGLTTTNQILLQQLESGGVYGDAYITIYGKTNGVQGGNSDNGNVITIETVWDTVPDGQVVGTGATTTCTVVFPSTSVLANTWGSVTITSSGVGG